MKGAGRFRLLAHTADIGLEVTAPSVEELFVAAAKGLRGMLFGISPAEEVLRLEVSLEAGNGAELLVAWLNEILCLSEMTRLVPATFEIIELTDNQLTAVVTGEPFDPARHTVERVAKAVTYHQLVMEERKSGWYARVYIDL
ncbi:MAG: archease [Desulfuromonadales bacterium]